MADQIILERAQEVDKYRTSEIVRLDIAVKGAALEELLRRAGDHDRQDWER